MRKKMWKKIIAWILCVCILTQSVPLDAASVSRIARGTELWTGGSQVNLNGTGETVFLSESTSDKGVVYSVDESGNQMVVYTSRLRPDGHQSNIALRIKNPFYKSI